MLLVSKVHPQYVGWRPTSSQLWHNFALIVSLCSMFIKRRHSTTDCLFEWICVWKRTQIFIVWNILSYFFMYVSMSNLHFPQMKLASEKPPEAVLEGVIFLEEHGPTPLDYGVQRMPSLIPYGNLAGQIFPCFLQPWPVPDFSTSQQWQKRTRLAPVCVGVPLYCSQVMNTFPGLPWAWSYVRRYTMSLVAMWCVT